MLRHTLASASLFIAASLAAPAMAQDDASREPPSAGRYQMVTTSDGTFMVDSMYGRVWQFQKGGAEGEQMVRVPIKRLGKLPEGQISRPLPVFGTQSQR